MTLEAGQLAPDFSLPADDGTLVSLADLSGKIVVLYFYPKDDTPGCTQEACDFRDSITEFSAPDLSRADTVILGVSKDSVARHAKFKKKFDLPFALLSDADSDVCERYGVWGEKSMYGRKYMGIERTTLLIDGQGIIRQIWPKVKVGGHAQAVLAAVGALR
jgi:thioredoxin-dependent peroxiredoxin